MRTDFLFSICCCLTFVTFTSCASWGERCIVAASCTDTFQYCEIISPTCGHGTCQCIPGTKWNVTSQSCKRAVDNLGEFCSNSSDICIPENSDCLNSICSCASGYKPGPISNTCVKSAAVRMLGQVCFNSDSCYYNLTCVDKVCQCEVGYRGKANYESYICEAVTVNEYCADNDDCARLKYSGCYKATCGCNFPTNIQRYQYELREWKYTCATQVITTEGGQCSPADGIVCMPRFYCGRCFPNQTSTNGTCLRPAFDYPYTDAGSYTEVMMSVLAFFLVFAAFNQLLN